MGGMFAFLLAIYVFAVLLPLDRIAKKVCAIHLVSLMSS